LAIIDIFCQFLYNIAIIQPDEGDKDAKDMTGKDFYKVLKMLGMRLGGGVEKEDAEDIEPCYVISVAARILGVHTHTLRYYERKGIIEPSRSQGNIRLYSRKDIDQLRCMKTLINDLGVNPSGAEVILRMGQYIVELKHRVGELEAELKKLGRRHKP